jgi:hypothetical protein
VSVRLASTLAFAALFPIATAGAQGRPGTPADSARSLITAEVRAFHRDLAGRNWNALLTHFWPAKITSRWEPPVDNPVWASASPSASPAIGSGGAHPAAQRCSGDDDLTVAIVGRWARVLVPLCAARPGGRQNDQPRELWMLAVGGRWKIVRL